MNNSEIDSIIRRKWVFEALGTKVIPGVFNGKVFKIIKRLQDFLEKYPTMEEDLLKVKQIKRESFKRRKWVLKQLDALLIAGIFNGTFKDALKKNKEFRKKYPEISSPDTDANSFAESGRKIGGDDIHSRLVESGNIYAGYYGSYGCGNLSDTHTSPSYSDHTSNIYHS